MNDLSIFNSIFNDILGTDGTSTIYNSTYSPKVNICEEDNKYTLEMELPGRSDKDINIELKQNTLTISSKVENDTNDTTSKRKYLIKECHKANFSRSFTLPQDIDDEGISASFKNGILKVDMNKKALATPKKITIATEN